MWLYPEYKLLARLIIVAHSTPGTSVNYYGSSDRPGGCSGAEFFRSAVFIAALPV